jgi:hypothetical protein
LERLLQITSTYFCAGAVLNEGKCTEAAPILRKHVMGRTFDQIQAVCAAKKWKVVEVMSTDLTVVTSNQPVQFYSARNVNYDALEERLDSEAESFSRFPGDAMTFNGKYAWWSWGHGKKAVKFNHEAVSFVMNLPNAVEGWRKWEDGRPVYGPMVFLCSGDKLPSREALGDNDPSRWEIRDNKPTDPWTRYIACPLRVDGQDKVQHIFLTGMSAHIAFKNLLRDFAKQGRSNMGKLPVVNVGTEIRERKENKNETYGAPTFELIAWDDPIAADLPESMTAEVAAKAIPEGNATLASALEKDAATVKAAAKPDDKDLFPGLSEDKAALDAIVGTPSTAAPATSQRRTAAAPATDAPKTGLFMGGSQGKRRTAVPA